MSDLPENHIKDRIDRAVERLGGAIAAQKVLDENPPHPGEHLDLRKNRHSVYVMFTLEIAEMQL